MVGRAGGPLPAALSGAAVYAEERAHAQEPRRWVWAGYLALLVASAFLFLRCLLDLVLVQRPLLAPNLAFGGLAWLSFTLIACLTAVAFRQTDRTYIASPALDTLPSPPRPHGPESATLTVAREWFDPTSMMMRGFAMVGHLAVVLGLMVLGRLHFQDATAGMAAAACYLILPYTGMYVRQVDHVWPVALIVWAFVAYRTPSLAGFLLGLATCPVYYPVLLVPVLLSFYFRRGAGRFLFFFLLSMALVLGTVALVLYVRGDLHASIQRALAQTGWQPWKTPPPDVEGFWTGVHSAYRIPVFLVYAAFVIATAFWPSPKNLAHLLALSTAVLIGTQFWYADQGGTYVLWYLPLFLLVVFRPNLDNARPAPLSAETDWVARSRHWLVRRARRLLRVQEATPTA
jgi:hypothetical protein